MNESFFDWLDIYQDHDAIIPPHGKTGTLRIDLETGQIADHIKSDRLHQRGSYSTQIIIDINGHRLRMSGNPSRYGRPDNLFGFKTLKECIDKYNVILQRMGLPEFRACTKTWQQWDDDSKRFNTLSDGATLREVHVTNNVCVGKGNEYAYIRALATQPYKNRVGDVYADGNTVDWRTKGGKKGTLVYASAYIKANEMRRKSLGRIKGSCNEDEVAKVLKVIEYCEREGVVRKESKIKSSQLRRSKARHYGIVTDSQLLDLHKPLLDVEKNLKVSKMDLETISQTLIRELDLGTLAANTSAFYAYQWMHGHIFDLEKSQVKIHRARLRSIGFDIKQPYDAVRNQPIKIIRNHEIEVKPLAIPSWYEMPRVLQAV
jgi:hypothetical protein